MSVYNLFKVCGLNLLSVSLRSVITDTVSVFPSVSKVNI